MKPQETQIKAFKKWFDEFTKKTAHEDGTISSEIALFEGLNTDDDPYQIKLVMTKEECDFCTKVMTGKRGE